MPEVPTTDQELYQQFIIHRDDFLVLYNTGIFSLRNGSMTVHKDNDGIVRKIETNQVLYKL